MRTVALDNVLARIANVTGRDPQLGWKGWQARCPAHDDSKASLSVGSSEDGRVLVHCHAGCATEEVLKALGFTYRDLGDVKKGNFRKTPTAGAAGKKSTTRRCSSSRSLEANPPSVPIPGGTPNGTQESSDIKHEIATMHTFREPQAAFSMLAATYGETSARYEYNDAAGNAVGYVLRWDTGDGAKTFRPVSRRGDEWVVSAMPTPRPLYRLVDLVQTQLGEERVFLVEGEKACDVVRATGLLATTTAGGSAAPHQSDLTPLAGRNIVILPDNDPAGEKYALIVAQSLLKLSPTPIVRIVRLPNLPPAGDIVEFIAANDTIRRENLGLAINALVDPVLPITARDLAKEVTETRPSRFESESQASGTQSPVDEAVVVCLSERKSLGVEWLWPGRIAIGKLTLLSGDPGLGKSMLTLDLAARVTRGSQLPATDQEDSLLGLVAPSGKPGSVILLSAEDDVDDTILPRLIGAKADLKRVFALQAVRSRSVFEGGMRESFFNLATDLEVLESLIAQQDSCRLVVIDPISAYCGSSDSHKNSEVRALLAPLAALAAHRQVAVVAVNHLNKSAQGPAIYRSMGSLAFAAAARSVLSVVADPHDASRRLCLSVKSNLSTRPPGIAYHVSEMAGGGAPTVDGTTPRYPVVMWHSDAVIDTADEVAQQQSQGAAAAEGMGEACEWLAVVLADGPVKATELKARAAEEGIAIRTL